MTNFKKVNLPITLVNYNLDLREFDRDLIKVLNELFTNIETILRRGIRFEDNVDCDIIDFTSSGTANAENTIAHNLGKVPVGYLVASVDKAAVIYKGTTAWTNSNIYLKADLATVEVKIIVF